MFKKDKFLRYALIATLFVRLLFVVAVLGFQADLDFMAYDSKEYIVLAEELLSAGRFFRTGIPAEMTQVDVPEIARTPGYPLFLIPGIILNHIKVVTVSLQILLCCLTVFLVYRLTLILFNRREIALIASLFVALDPMSTFFSIYILTETLFTFLIAAFMYYAIRYLENHSYRHIILAAFVLAASMFVRPASYYYPLLFFVILLVIGFKNSSRKKFILLHAAIFLVASLGPALLWQLRNKAATGYAEFSAIRDFNIYFNSAAGVLAVKEKKPFVDTHLEMGSMDMEKYFKYHPDQRTWNESERINYMKREGIRIIKDDLLIYTVLHAKGVLRVFLDPGVIRFFKLFKLEPELQYAGSLVDQGIIQTILSLYKDNPVIFIFYAVFGAVQFLMGIFLIAALFPKNIIHNLPIIVLFSIVLYFLIISGGPAEGPRYRLQFLPAYAVLSAYGLFICLDKIRLLRNSSPC